MGTDFVNQPVAAKSNTVTTPTRAERFNNQLTLEEYFLVDVSIPRSTGASHFTGFIAFSLSNKVHNAGLSVNAFIDEISTANEIVTENCL